MFENPRRGIQARNFTTNVPKILDLKSSSEQIFSENCRWVPLSHVILLRIALHRISRPRYIKHKLKSINFYLRSYFGHGTGREFLRGDDIQRLDCRAVTVLMGCSSGKLTVRKCG